MTALARPPRESLASRAKRARRRRKDRAALRVGTRVYHVLAPHAHGTIVAFLNYGYTAAVRWDHNGDTVTHDTENLKPERITQ